MFLMNQALLYRQHLSNFLEIQRFLNIELLGEFSSSHMCVAR